MGVELRGFQRQFHTLMDTMKPQIRPRFVVWLDERLAEFKIQGRMKLDESLDDPQWIKNYLTSKRQAKEAAIKKREARDAGSSGSGSVVHPKDETKSESSNGVAHHTDLQDESKDHTANEEQQMEEKPEASSLGQDFQLVEVKQELVEDEDDDMIIVGETLGPQLGQENETPYVSQFNPNRQMFSGSRHFGSFQRKRQKFGSLPLRSPQTMSANRFKNRTKVNFRTPVSLQSATSESLSSSSMYQSNPPVFPVDVQQVYDTNLEHFSSVTDFNPNETLHIPRHLQTESASAQMQLTEGIYGDEEGDMYAEYGDESYDSSYMAESAETSLQYDEEGNVVIHGDIPGDDSMLEPTPGTSDGASQDFVHSTFREKLQYRCEEVLRDTNYDDEIKGYRCPYSSCSAVFRQKTSISRHVKFVHFLLKKPYSCELCDMSFNNKSGVEGHMNAIHLSIRPFACVCGVKYAHEGHLQQHIKRCPIRAKFFIN